MTEGNKENLSFIIEITKKLRIKKNNLIKTLKNFKGLKYRQQIIHRSKNLTIINDSKATSYSSSINILKSLSNVYWIVGGLAKKGDKFLLSKNECKTFKVYIFGKDKKYFVKQLKNIINYQRFKNLKFLIKKILIDIKKEKSQKHRIILFSPAAASFDSFKNFEDRGEYFNSLIKKIVNV
jgi:UDP-N-acetylmuramoylalanine--D-glutamate ligase